MQLDALDCRVKDRRKKLLGNRDWNGIDFLEVSDDQRSLCVHFFGGVPQNVTIDNVHIEGGRRIRGIRAVSVKVDTPHDDQLDDCLRIVLDQGGDFSIYRLCLVEKVAPRSLGSVENVAWRPLSGFDPRYACIDFSFKIDCPSDVDCKAAPACPPEISPTPEINYLAKDYASFRQLIFDRLALLVPEWQEGHVPDVGVTLVEVLAYAADYLSYFQDAVATEAYLDTARLRTSVRRHVRLVDYQMHEGANARAWVAVSTKTDLAPLKPKDFYFITGFRGVAPESGRVIEEAALAIVPRTLYEVFEPLILDANKEIEFRAAHSEIRFYTWGDQECCLPTGATRATLLDDSLDAETPPPSSPGPVGARGKVAKAQSLESGRLLLLKVGDVLIFEEVIGPTTGNPADADPLRRHAVLLTRVTLAVDGLLGKKVVEIEWGPEDALPFRLCLSARLAPPDCRRVSDVSVARGNVVLVDHGRKLTEPEPMGPVDFVEAFGDCACDGGATNVTRTPAPFKPRLTLGPLTFAQPLRSMTSAAQYVMQDVRLALPELALVEFAESDVNTASGPWWTPAADLLASGAEDRHFVVEVDDFGTADLRFGDGELGRAPEGGARFRATYRVGNGQAGNVGRDTIQFLVTRGFRLGAEAIEPRNPLAAQGGTPPESTASVKLVASQAYRGRRERAITADDYAELAQRNAKVQRAAAELAWTGSWYEARVAIDALNVGEADVTLLQEIQGSLFGYRRLGHDLAVLPARLVPLHIAMDVCVLPDFARGHVRAEVGRALGNQRMADGKLGFFHPDNLTFGEPVRLSRLIARVKEIPGVETVTVTDLRRIDTPDLHGVAVPEGTGTAIADGSLPIRPMEVAQLDNDPNLPENGTIKIRMGGGR